VRAMRNFFRGFTKKADKYKGLFQDALSAYPRLVGRYGAIGAGLGAAGYAGRDYLTADEALAMKGKLRRAASAALTGAAGGLAAGLTVGVGRGAHALGVLRNAQNKTRPVWQAAVNDVGSLSDLLAAAKEETLKDKKLSERLRDVRRSSSFLGDLTTSLGSPKDVEEMIAEAEYWLHRRKSGLDAWDLFGKGENSLNLWFTRLTEALESGRAGPAKGKIQDLLGRLESEGIRDHKQFARKYHPDMHKGKSPMGDSYAQVFEALQSGKKNPVDDAYPNTRAWAKNREVEATKHLDDTLRKSPLWRYLEDKYK
jgi:hypothetical protein